MFMCLFFLRLQLQLLIYLSRHLMKVWFKKSSLFKSKISDVITVSLYRCSCEVKEMMWMVWRHIQGLCLMSLKSCTCIHVHLLHFNCCSPQGSFYDPASLLKEPQRTVMSLTHLAFTAFPWNVRWEGFLLYAALLAAAGCWLNERSSQSWPLPRLLPFILRLMTEAHTAALLYCVALPHVSPHREVL